MKITTCAVVTSLESGSGDTLKVHIGTLGDFNGGKDIVSPLPKSLAANWLPGVELEIIIRPRHVTEAMDAEEIFAYKVRRGDNLELLAVGFNKPVALLRQLNRIDNPAHIEAGWMLLVPRE